MMKTLLLRDAPQALRKLTEEVANGVEVVLVDEDRPWLAWPKLQKGGSRGFTEALSPTSATISMLSFPTLSGSAESTEAYT